MNRGGEINDTPMNSNFVEQASGADMGEASSIQLLSCSLSSISDHRGRIAPTSPNSDSDDSIYADVVGTSSVPSRGIRRRASIERSHVDLSLKVAEICALSDETHMSLTETTSEKRALEESIEKITQERDELRTAIDNLEASFTVITQKQSKTFAESMEELQEELRSCTQERTELRLQLESLQAERDRYRERYRMSLEEHDRVQKERDDFKDEVSQLRVMIGHLARDIEETKRQRRREQETNILGDNELRSWSARRSFSLNFLNNTCESKTDKNIRMDVKEQHESALQPIGVKAAKKLRCKRFSLPAVIDIKA